MFRNVKLILIRKTFRNNVYKMFNRSTIETKAKIANVCRVTSNNNNALVLRF